MLRAEMHDLGHAAIGGGKTVMAGLQEFRDLRRRPAVAQVDGVPTVNGRSGEEVFAAVAGLTHGLFLKREPTRRMAGAAVAQPLHDVGAAIPLRRFGGIGLERRVVEKRHVPKFQAETQAERPLQLVRPVWPAYRRNAMHQVRIQRLHVASADLRERRIGHRRVEIAAVRRDACTHGAIELREGVAADSGFDVGRDVGGVNHAERRVHSQSARQRFAVGRGVACDAIAEARNVFPTPDLRIRRLARRGGVRLMDRESRQEHARTGRKVESDSHVLDPGRVQGR